MLLLENFKSIYSQKHDFEYNDFNNYVACLKEPIITKTDIMREIKNIDLNKASGDSPIDNKLLKQINSKNSMYILKISKSFIIIIKYSFS
jgi:hypothetical protein